MMVARRSLAVLMVALAVRPAGAPAQGLFRRTEPLEITITTALDKLVKDRDSTDRVSHGAELAYKDTTGTDVRVPILLRTRGHFRRQFRNCDFPPLRIEVTREAAQRTVFQGNRTLKLTSNCRPSSRDYEQYILQEAALYRMYQVITPWSYRTRLAHITFRDSTSRTKQVESWAFLVEDDGDLAQRRNTVKFETKGAYFEDLQQDHWSNVQLFQYMIGNTDWSLSALHNITLLKDSAGVIHPVPFDFDWTGAVDARYSFPDKSLPIRSVRDRLWRGDCRTAEAHAPVLERFTARRAALDSAYMQIDALSPAVKERMRNYFAGFWSQIEDPIKAASVFKRTCGVRN